MPEWLETRGSDLLMLVWLFSSFTALILLTNLGYALVGQVAYFTIIIFGMLGTDIYIREKVNRYPYLLAIVRPINKRLHLFIESGTAKKIGQNHYVAELNLAFPVKYLDYGKVKRIKLHYQGEWSRRVDLRPGYANYYGYEVSHPQTEIIEVYQVTRGSTSIDHAEPVPVFFLHSASRDCYLEGLSSQLVKTNPNVNPALLEAYEARIRELEAENADLRQKVAEWQQTALSYEEIIEQQKAEIRGLLEAKTGVKELAYEYLLTLYQAAGSIEAALRHIKGPTIPKLGKWFAAVIISGLFVAYLWANPQIVEQMIAFMQSTAGMVLGLVLICVLGVILYKLLVKGK